jgi:hypothetical protein
MSVELTIPVPGIALDRMIAALESEKPLGLRPPDPQPGLFDATPRAYAMLAT